MFWVLGSEQLAATKAMSFWLRRNVTHGGGTQGIRYIEKSGTAAVAQAFLVDKWPCPAVGQFASEHPLFQHNVWEFLFC